MYAFKKSGHAVKAELDLEELQLIQIRPGILVLHSLLPAEKEGEGEFPIYHDEICQAAKNSRTRDNLQLHRQSTIIYCENCASPYSFQQAGEG